MKNKPFPEASEKSYIVPSLICAGAIYAPVNGSVFLQVIHLEPNAPLWSSNPTPSFNYLEKSLGMNHPTRGIYAIKAFEARDLPHKKLGESKCLLKYRMIWLPCCREFSRVHPWGRAALSRQGRPAENGAKRSHSPASPAELSYFSDAGNSFGPGGKRKLGKL